MSPVNQTLSDAGDGATPWDAVIPAADRGRYERAGFGRRGGLGNRPAVLVIDVQYQTTGPSPMPIDEAVEIYPRACGAPAWDAVGRIADLLSTARDVRVPIFYLVVTERSHGIGRLRSKAPNKFYAGDPYKIVAEVAPHDEDVVLAKQFPSAFFGTPLISQLTDDGIDTVILCGCTTSGCVRATAIDAFSYNLHVGVPQECVYDRSEISHAVSLFDIDSKYGDVAPTATIQKYLGAVSASDSSGDGLG